MEVILGHLKVAGRGIVTPLRPNLKNKIMFGQQEAKALRGH